MAGRQCNQFVAPAREQGIGHDQQSCGFVLNKGGVRYLHLACVACVMEAQLQPQRSRCSFQLFHFWSGLRVGRINQHSDHRYFGHQFVQQLKSLSRHCKIKQAQAGEITPRSAEAGDEIVFDRIASGNENDWNGRGRDLCGSCGGGAANRGNNSDLTTNKVSSQLWQSFVMIVCPAIFNREILTFDKLGLSQALTKRSNEICKFG